MKLGADPEFFVVDSHSTFINAIKVCNNKKSKPYKLSKDSILYHDNVLLEVNIQPANNEEEFVSRIIDARDSTRNLINDHKISLHAYAEFEQEELKYENAREFGCVPDLNAYTLTENELQTEILKNINCRMAGGHLHIGGGNSDLVCHPLFKPLFTYMLDLFVGIPSVLIDNSAESYRRRSFFGTAGSYRDTEYGLEYRVLSPFWLRSESTIGLIYLLCDFVFHEMNDGLFKKFYNFSPEKLKSNDPISAYSCYGYDQASLVNAINSNNFSNARKFFNFASNFMPNKLIELVEYEINNPKKLQL
jgi:hypothetical protein